MQGTMTDFPLGQAGMRWRWSDRIRIHQPNIPRCPLIRGQTIWTVRSGPLPQPTFWPDHRQLTAASHVHFFFFFNLLFAPEPHPKPARSLMAFSSLTRWRNSSHLVRPARAKAPSLSADIPPNVNLHPQEGISGNKVRRIRARNGANVRCHALLLTCARPLAPTIY